MVATVFPEVRGTAWSLLENTTQPSPPSDSAEALVTRVVDGDTFVLEGGERVRLIGIDAPESVKPNSPVECFGHEASNFLKQMIEGKRVRLERDVSDRDRYGRLLRYAYLDGQLLNAELVAAGYARVATYPPDVRETEGLRLAEKQAQGAGVGLWNQALCP